MKGHDIIQSAFELLTDDAISWKWWDGDGRVNGAVKVFLGLGALFMSCVRKGEVAGPCGEVDPSQLNNGRGLHTTAPAIMQRIDRF